MPQDFTALIGDALQAAVAAKTGNLLLPLAGVAHSAGNSLRLDRPLTSAIATGAWNGTFSADANVSCGYDVLDNTQAQPLGLTAPDGHSLLSIALAGQLGFDLNGSHASGPFGATAAAGAQGGLSLTWVFAEPSTELAGAVLARDARQLSLPLNLAALQAQTHSPSWLQTRMTVDGKLQAGIDLHAGVGAAGWTWSAAGERRLPVGLNIGINGSVALSVSGTFHLSAGRDPSGIRVKLEREQKNSADFGLAIGATADVSAVLSDAAALLSASLPNPERYAHMLLPILEPTPYLIQEIGRAIDAETAPNSVERALARLALGLDGPMAAKSAVQKTLSELVQRELGQTLPSSPQALSAAVSAALAGLPAPLQPAVSAALAVWISAQWHGIDALADKLSAQVTGPAQKAVDELGAFGAAVGARIADLGTAIGSSGLATAIRQALAAYGALRAKWIDALTQAAQAKLAATLGANYSAGDDDALLLDLVFHDGDPAAAADALYAGLVRGSLDDLPALVRAAAAQVSVNGGSLLHKMTRAASATVNLNLLGSALSWSSTAAAALKVEASLFGDLNAAAGDADVSAAAKTWFGDFHSALGCQFSYRHSGPEFVYAVSFHGGYTFRGEALSREQFDGLLKSLQYLCALPSPSDLAQRLGLPDGAAPDFAHAMADLELVLPIALDADDLTRFEQSQDLADLSAAAAIAVADLYYRNTHDFGYALPSELIGGAANDAGQSPAALLQSLPAWYDYAQIAAVFFPGAPQSGTIGDNLNLRRAKVIGRIAGLVAGVVAMQQALRAIRARSAGGALDSESAREAVLALLQEICRAVSPAAVASDTALGNERSMPWALTAFCAALASATQRPLPGAFTPVAKCTSSSGVVTTLVLTRL